MKATILRALALAGALLLAAAHAGAAPPPAAVPGAPAPGFEVVAVTYLLRAPDGALVRVRVDRPATGLPGRPGWAAFPGARGGAGVRPAAWGWDWLARLFGEGRQLYAGLLDTVRETWNLARRLLSLLGVVVLFVSAWVIWFLVRPALPGVTERQAFLLVFILLAAGWLYFTGIYTSVVYAAALMAAPGALLAAAAWLWRRLWAGLRGAQ